MNWQPIETAPKEGAVILIGDGKDHPIGQREGKFWPPSRGVWSERESLWCHELDGFPFGIPMIQPTHWQPLPKPPT